MPEGIKMKVLDFLQRNKGNEYAVEDIAEALKVEKVSVLKAQLTRLVKEGKVERTPEGKYRAK